MAVAAGSSMREISVTLDPVETSGARKWTIGVSMRNRKIGKLIAITPEMRANEPLDADYEAIITKRIIRVNDDGDTLVTEFAPTIIDHRDGDSARDNVFIRAMRLAISARRKFARQHSVSVRSDGVSVPLVAPMLAANISSIKPDWTSGRIYVQRKYDGLRALGTVDGSGIPILYGRGAYMFAGPAVARIKLALARIMGSRVDARGVYTDGELYVHGMSLQEIESAATNGRATISLNYVVYDLITLAPGQVSSKLRTAARQDNANDDTYPVRLEKLRALMREEPTRDDGAIIVAETFECASMDCARDLFARFLREGYEGAILRTSTSPYVHGRSSSLIKMKLTQDAEFRIVGFTQGERGSAKGALLFVCATDSGRTFVVTPTGSLDARKKMFAAFTRSRAMFARDWLGKPLIVKFDALSRDGIPLRARTDGVIRTVQ
jgi:hypothetical protein